MEQESDEEKKISEENMDEETVETEEKDIWAESNY